MTESPESSADGMGAKGLGGFTAISSEDPGTFRGGMPKSASTSHLSGLQSATTSHAVRSHGCPWAHYPGALLVPLDMCTGIALAKLALMLRPA